MSEKKNKQKKAEQKFKKVLRSEKLRQELQAEYGSQDMGMVKSA